jgi:hypothetical protein
LVSPLAGPSPELRDATSESFQQQKGRAAPPGASSLRGYRQVAGIKHAVRGPTALWPGEAGVESAAAAVAGDTPHFYGPFANSASSPLPSVRGGVVHVGNSLTARQFATD